ncbi:TPA: exosome complex RNA-binding protein Csl4 [Candidatus Micrarchaeota archaeon]|nr:exosome complex RNA-binding protein Csl4 [Candidatus Micrarchaeota archaeon]
MKFIFPGEPIAVSEEAQADTGTVEDEGTVYASVLGEEELKGGIAKVTNPGSPRMLRKGDTIYGVIMDIFDQIALVEFKPAGKGVVSGDDRAFLRITEIQERGKGYVESFRDFMRIGDVLKAKIIDVTPMGVYLTIVPRGYGIVKAYCSFCRVELDEKLECAQCGRKERRKMAYG